MYGISNINIGLSIIQHPRDSDVDKIVKVLNYMIMPKKNYNLWLVFGGYVFPIIMSVSFQKNETNSLYFTKIKLKSLIKANLYKGKVT